MEYISGHDIFEIVDSVGCAKWREILKSDGVR